LFRLYCGRLPPFEDGLPDIQMFWSDLISTTIWCPNLYYIRRKVMDEGVG